MLAAASGGTGFAIELRADGRPVWRSDQASGDVRTLILYSGTEDAAQAMPHPVFNPEGPRGRFARMRYGKTIFTILRAFVRLQAMLKRISGVVSLPLLMLVTGCTSTFTNLTPQTQMRSPDNQYKVEVAMASRQQSLRWDSIKPQIQVGTDYYPMRPTMLMTNRWEGFLPVPAGTSIVHYRYKFDFNYNGMGAARSDSAISPQYSLRIVDGQ